MTRLAQLLHLDDGEFPELRAQIEAKPIPARPASRRENWGRDMIAFLRSQDAETEPRPLPPLTDWSAQLAVTFGAVDHRLDNLGEALVREATRNAVTDEYSAQVVTSPLLAAIIDLTAVRLPDWRKALTEHAEAELALIDAELAVSL